MHAPIHWAVQWGWIQKRGDGTKHQPRNPKQQCVSSTYGENVVVLLQNLFCVTLIWNLRVTRFREKRDMFRIDWESRPESGLDWLVCAIFARQRTPEMTNKTAAAEPPLEPPGRAIPVKVAAKRLPVFLFSGFDLYQHVRNDAFYDLYNLLKVRKTGKREVVLLQPLPQTL